jgi:acetyl-CoA carboxylase carboxyl transferase subunit alpha
LWKNAAAAPEAAAAMKITANDLKKLGVIDEIVPEPPGGAHGDPKRAAELLEPCLDRGLRELQKLKPPLLLGERFEKFRKMGVFEKG